MLAVTTGARNHFTAFWTLYKFGNDVPGRAAIKDLQEFNMHVTKVCKPVCSGKPKRSQAGFYPFYTSKMIKKKKKI